MRPLHHGGRLREAACRYAIPLDAWLDLSTGINPLGWPVPMLSADCWQRLPEEDDGLELAATTYYGSGELLPVAGSQAAIQALPRLRVAARVGMLWPSYVEHAAAWRAAGHEVVELRADAIERMLPQLDVLLLVNPNNPTGERFTLAQLLAWRQALSARGGWLVVDEAFVDATPERSLAHHAGEEGLVVLRSLGKFFGLAGVRVGFVFAWPGLRQRLAALLGPWSVSGPSREVARLALADIPWQATNRACLQRDSERLHILLASHGLTPAGGTALFCYCQSEAAAGLHEALARQGILTRLFHDPAALRFGLPGSDEEWQRLACGLAAVMTTTTQKAVQC
ncbi:MAG: threonine-phosphate decarboxylase CobD [Gammaproteobacteria bacterium]|nr:threonine-phosphate decarboxylase CobD [Gammaproteobacteria bacterium]